MLKTRAIAASRESRLLGLLESGLLRLLESGLLRLLESSLLRLKTSLLRLEPSRALLREPSWLRLETTAEALLLLEIRRYTCLHRILLIARLPLLPLLSHGRQAQVVVDDACRKYSAGRRCLKLHHKIAPAAPVLRPRNKSNCDEGIRQMIQDDDDDLG
jgi:hypothetical protein